jgi:hypothetical protein
VRGKAGTAIFIYEQRRRFHLGVVLGHFARDNLRLWLHRVPRLRMVAYQERVQVKYPPLSAKARERRQIGRRIANQLPVILPERTVADMMGLSQTMVAIIANEALYKIAMRMKCST